MKSYIHVLYFFLILICAIPHQADAKDIEIRTQGNEVFELSAPLVVKKDDVLRIASGSRIKVTQGGYMYVEGSLLIGMDQASSTPNSKVHIDSYSSKSFIQINGGTLLANNMFFTGSRFVDAYNRAKVSINLSDFVDSNPTSNMYSTESPMFTAYNNSLLDMSYGSVDSLKNGADAQFVPKKHSSLISVYASSTLLLTNMYLYSDVSERVITLYDRSISRVNDINIISCQVWFYVFNRSALNGSANTPDCAPQIYNVFNESMAHVDFTKDCCSSVLFIPGIQGSRLYKKDIFENQLWEPNRDADVAKLFMNASGTSIELGIYTKDVIDKTNLTGNYKAIPVYEGVLHFLAKLSSDKLIREYETYPYDWRISPNDMDMDFLIKRLENMAKRSNSGKVSILAHSYGGILTKELLLRLSRINRSHLIDKVIMVGVPETGAPESIFAILHGKTSAHGFVYSQKTAMKLAMNMPSAYQLLPSFMYSKPISLLFRSMSNSEYRIFDYNRSHKIADALNWVRTQFTSQIGTKSDIHIDEAGSLPNLVTIPLAPSVNSNLETVTKIYQGTFGSTTKYNLESRYNIWSIVGVGQPTVSGMSYVYNDCIHKLCSRQTLFNVPRYSGEGDGTVIYDAYNNRTGHIVKVDLAKMNKQKNSNIKHASLLESSDIQTLVQQIIVTDGVAMSGGYVIDESEREDMNKIYYITFNGNMVGGIKIENPQAKYFTAIVPQGDTYKMIEEIPNSSITKIGDTVTITTSIQPTHIEFTSTNNQRIDIASGSLSIPGSSSNTSVLQEYETQESDLAHEIYFNQIPATRGSVIDLDTTTSKLQIDINHDGLVDKEYQPSQISSTTSTTTILSVRIRNLTDTLLTHKNKINSVKTASLRAAYVPYLLRIISEVEGVQRAITQSKLTKTTLSGRELSRLRSLTASLDQVILKINEQESLYTQKIREANTVLAGTSKPFLKLRASQQIARAEAYLSDISVLYIALTGAQDSMLEFLSSR